MNKDQLEKYLIKFALDKGTSSTMAKIAAKAGLNFIEEISKLNPGQIPSFRQKLNRVIPNDVFDFKNEIDNIIFEFKEVGFVPMDSNDFRTFAGAGKNSLILSVDTPESIIEGYTMIFDPKGEEGPDLQIFIGTQGDAIGFHVNQELASELRNINYVILKKLRMLLNLKKLLICSTQRLED